MTTTQPVKELLGPNKYAEYLAASRTTKLFTTINPNQLTNEELIVLTIMLQSTIVEMTQCISDVLARSVHLKSADDLLQNR